MSRFHRFHLQTVIQAHHMMKYRTPCSSCQQDVPASQIKTQRFHPPQATQTNPSRCSHREIHLQWFKTTKFPALIYPNSCSHPYHKLMVCQNRYEYTLSGYVPTYAWLMWRFFTQQLIWTALCTLLSVLLTALCIFVCIFNIRPNWIFMVNNKWSFARWTVPFIS